LAISWRGYETGENMVRMLEIPSGRELRPLKGVDSNVSALAFSPDGTRLAAAGLTVHVWDPVTAHDLLTLRDVPGAVQRMQFSPDGRRLIAIVGPNGKFAVKTWDAMPRAAK
jgi:WD40 repeat protein